MDYLSIKKVLAKINDIEVRSEVAAIIELILAANAELKERISLLERQIFGKKSEKHKESTEPEVAPLFDDQERDEITIGQTTETITYTRKKPSKNRRGRFDTSQLPKRTIIHDLPIEEQCCNQCHAQLEKIGEDTSQQVETIPQQCILIEHLRIKYTCRNCEIVVSGKKEPSAIPKAMVGNSVLAQVVVDKYCNHLPVYRQAQIYTRQGFVLEDITIGRWVMKLGEVFAPLGKALWSEIEASSYLQVDETPVLCLEYKKKCYMWTYVKFNNFRPILVVFDFQMTRGQIAVNTRLANFQGIVQTDGYAGYNTLRKRKNIIGIGCGAHIRRKFDEVSHLSDGPHPVADKVIAEFKKLYDIEEKCRQEKSSSELRTLFRQEHAQQILTNLYQYLNEVYKATPPKSSLGRAIDYAIKEWSFWSNYIDYGEAFIDTNWAENQIRPFALGRRNWLFIGNQNGGETGALLYSLVQSAKLNQLDPWRYLFYVLHHSHELRRNIIKPLDLLPHRVDQTEVNTLAEKHISNIIKLRENITIANFHN